MKPCRFTSTTLMFVGLVLGCDAEGKTQAQNTEGSATGEPLSTAKKGNVPSPASESLLTRVNDRSLVCMVNNQFMGQPQIPIEVEGRTYYGCCEMCKGRLADDPTSRSATDPISGNAVDKATAVIARDNRGRTFYFQNEETFAAYARAADR